MVAVALGEWVRRTFVEDGIEVRPFEGTGTSDNTGAGVGGVLRGITGRGDETNEEDEARGGATGSLRGAERRDEAGWEIFFLVSRDDAVSAVEFGLEERACSHQSQPVRTAAAMASSQVRSRAGKRAVRRDRYLALRRTRDRMAPRAEPQSSKKERSLSRKLAAISRSCWAEWVAG